MQFMPTPGSMIKSPHLFLFWWAVQAPKKILLIIKRIILLVNNQISFTTNLKLLFTPLFGDYTIIGRIIGFNVRIVEIFFGIIAIILIGIFYPIAPLIWWILPIVLLFKIKIFALFVYGAIYLFWDISSRNTPEKYAKDCSQANFKTSFRPSATNIIETLHNSIPKGIVKLLNTADIAILLYKLELNSKEFKEKLVNCPAFNINAVQQTAWELAKNYNNHFVEDEHIFLAILKTLPKPDIILATFNNKMTVVENGTKDCLEVKNNRDKMYIWQDDYDKMLLGGTGKGMTGRVTPFLDSISVDFTRQAIRGGYKRYTAREANTKKLAQLLSASNDNILIIGQPGSGKTSVIRGVAYKIMEGTDYKSLKNKRIVSIDLGSLIGGTQSQGEIADKLKYAIGEAKLSRDIILFIDEIHTLVAGSGKNPEVSIIFNLLEPELSSGQIQFIGATTIQNYRKYIEPNGAFARLFNIMEIGEASVEETLEVAKYVVKDIESKKKVIVTYPALMKSIELSKKLIHERVLPDKALVILDRAATKVEDNTRYLNAETVAQVISEMTHIPTEMVSADEAKKLLNIETEMQKIVIGQNAAIEQIGSALKRARAGIRNENKPIASFLFVGTTGVGKTQTAKALAKCFFGNSKTMIRLDMSEYQQADSISRLLGTPDGSTKGILTEAVRQQPFALILLDEIEKAHSNILLAFLQVLDEGRLTDPSGMTMDFTNSIIIATSNVGTRAIQDIFNTNNYTAEKMQEAAMKEVRTHFAPEFLNRFTGIIVFNPLTIEDVRKIAVLMLSDVQKAADTKNVKVNFKPELIDELIKRGYNPEWGARPLARVIEDTVESYIAVKLLSQEFNPGDTQEIGMEAFNKN